MFAILTGRVRRPFHTKYDRKKTMEKEKRKKMSEKIGKEEERMVIEEKREEERGANV